MTDKITLAVVHGAAQFTVATLVGKILDGILPYSKSKMNVMQLSAEIILQISADVICTAAIMEYLNNSLPADQYDPSNGFAYLLGLLSSQPNLIGKISKLNSIIGSKLGNIAILKRDKNQDMGAPRVPVSTENQFISGNAAYN